MTTGENGRRPHIGHDDAPPGGWVREHYGFGAPALAATAVGPRPEANASGPPPGRESPRRDPLPATRGRHGLRTVLAGGLLGVVLAVGAGGLAFAATHGATGDGPSGGRPNVVDQRGGDGSGRGGGGGFHRAN